jgi:hypothetical protein
MVLIGASTILPMFLLWSRLCDYFRSYELPESDSSPFWIKPEWFWDRVVTKEITTALKEVGLHQRVDRSVASCL